MHVDATLTLRSPTVAAGDMSRRLAIEPDDSWEPGDSLARRRSPRMRRNDHGWAVRVSATDAADALDDILARLGTGAGAINRLLAEGDTRVDLVLFTCDSSGAEISPVDAGIARISTALGAGLVATGETGAGSARVCTWTTAAA